MTSIFSIIPPFLAVGELLVKQWRELLVKRSSELLVERSSDRSNYFKFKIMLWYFCTEFKSMLRYFSTGIQFLLTGRPNTWEQDLLETRRGSWSPLRWLCGKSNSKLRVCQSSVVKQSSLCGSPFRHFKLPGFWDVCICHVRTANDRL